MKREQFLKHISALYFNPRVRLLLVGVFIFAAGFFVGSHFNKPNIKSQQETEAQISLDSLNSTQNQSEQIQVVPLQPAVQALTPQKNEATIEQVAPVVPPVDNKKTISASIRSGDNLLKLFKRNGIDQKDARTILALKQTGVLNTLRPGKKISLIVEKVEEKEKVIKTNKSNNKKNKKQAKQAQQVQFVLKTKLKVRQLIYVASELDTITVTWRNGIWNVQVKHIEPTVKLSYASVPIAGGSIYSAARKQGISQKIASQVAGIFSKTMNIARMGKGDRFSVCYKEQMIGNKKIGEDKVVAAEILHKGRLHRMIGFTDPKGNTGFYTPEGYSDEPLFIRNPVSFRGVGSRFSLHRLHPILGYSKPHLGVDFVASHGEPVRATSDGKIEFAGSKSGYGRTLVVKNGIYSTLYAHLSKFAGNMFAGKHVKQGEVIGYVGATGLASGPHLHYEFQINGVHHDPLNVKLPGKMIPAEYRKSFFAYAKRMLTQLNMHNSNRMVAMNSDNKA